MQRSKRKNTASIVDFWECKLNVNYEAEIEYYRKLCGYKYKLKRLRNNPKYDTETEYLSYEKWERHILNDISVLNIKELETYYRFLNQKCRENNMIITLRHSILMPFVMAFLTIILDKLINSYIEINSLIVSVLIIIIIFLSFAVTIFKDLVTPEKDEEIARNFYQDVKEIVEIYKNRRRDN